MDNRKFIRMPKKKEWMMILLVGVLLIVISIPTKKESSTTFEDNYETNLEQRLAETLKKMKYVGDVHVMITYQEDEKIEGIVILSEGAQNAVVVRNITEVVQALFDVDSHKIKVIESTQTN